MKKQNSTTRAGAQISPLPFQREKPGMGWVNQSAFTRVEMIVTVAIVFVAGALALPFIGKGIRTSKLQRCQDNLRQVGQGGKGFAADHRERFPWQIPTADGGTMQLSNAWQHFLVLSNYGMNASVSLCPADPDARTSRWPNSTSEQTTNPKLSPTYFVGLDSYSHIPQTLLSGDYDIAGLVPNSGCRWMQSPVASLLRDTWARDLAYSWTNRLHKKNEGNLLLADGSTSTGDAKHLNRAIELSEEGSSFLNHILTPPFE